MNASGPLGSRFLTLAGLLVAGISTGGCYYVEAAPQAAGPEQYPQAPQDPQAQQGPQAPQAPQAQGGEGQDDVTVADFNEPLSAHGAWLDDPQYGRVWQPGGEEVGEDFVPYTTGGEWVAGDNDTWAFQSRWDNDWGWATYHYGRWYWNDDYGWLWQPGTAWAPSQVEWRYGGGYVGWAPLAPAGYVMLESRWGFVEERHFGGYVAGYRVPPDRVHGVYVGAAPITGVYVNGGANYRVGPSYARVRASGAQVRQVRMAPPGRGYARAYARASVNQRAGANPGARPAGAGGYPGAHQGAAPHVGAPHPARPAQAPRRRAPAAPAASHGRHR